MNASVLTRLASLALFFMWTAASAQVPQAVLFEGEGLEGRKLTLRTDEPDLADSDFAARAKSILIRAGTWQVCTGTDYRGNCTTLRPGEYRRLDAPYVMAITSLRPSGGVAQSGSQAVYPSAAPAVMAVPAYPTSCRVDRVGECGGCQITCAPGQQAKCEQGTYVADGRHCAFAATCTCK
jgi:hypothetical protein